MPDSPMQDSSQVLRLSILSAGTAIADAVKVASVTVTRALNKIPYARIEMFDGDMPNQDFPLSAGDGFVPGAEIEIKAGYGVSEQSLFKGIVVRHGIKVTGSNGSRLVIECRDEAVKLTIGRKSAEFVDQKDSEIMEGLIKTYRLKAEIEATGSTHEEMLQYYCSDWDFLLSRAEANGLVVAIEDGALKVARPDASAKAVLKLTYGYDLIELHADIDARTQFKQVTAVSWDPSQQQSVEQSVPAPTLGNQGNLKSADLAGVAGPDDFRLQTPAQVAEADLKTWARAQQDKAGLARIRGRMSFQGNASAVPGCVIELAGVGARFNGGVYVGAVSHRISGGEWVTEASFGMAPEWFAEQRDLVAPPAAGLLPGVEGLQIGVVKKIHDDPGGESRVQVMLPLVDPGGGTWARLAGFHASNGIGAFFVPEIGDEVLVGFLNNDPNGPIVLGSLYSKKNPPPYQLEEGNNTKAIVTRGEMKIEFDEEKKVVTIVTPAENTLVLDDDGKKILLQDQTGNKIEFNSDGIAMESPGDISIKAKGKIGIEAMQAIEVKATQDLSAEGLNVDLTAQIGLTAKGSASAELSASGQTTVKGAMVMIN